MPPVVVLTLPEPISRIANAPNRRLAWEFFVFFSRFEYALKRDKRFLMPRNGNAAPNWDCFASDHDDAFGKIALTELKAAVNFYLSESPRKQVITNGVLNWSDPQKWNEQERQLVWLLRMVRVVRNNLFHGGKFPLEPICDPSRNQDLLMHAVRILAECLKLDPHVEHLFLEGINE